MFKVGDRVYHIEYGWGIITEKDDKDIKLKFGDASVWTDAYNNLLSFTEYTLQGFSQERPPVELPEVGDWCLVRDNKHTVWQAGFFKEYRHDNEFPFATDIGSWKQIKRIQILD